MGGTKIFVLRIKDIIKIAAIAIAGLVILGLLVYLFIPRGGQEVPRPIQPAAMYMPGTYMSTIILNDRPLDIFVTVTANEIIAVEMTEMYESQRLLFPLFESAMARLSDDVLFYQRTDVVVHNDYPVTTGLLQQAVDYALGQAKICCTNGATLCCHDMPLCIHHETTHQH